MKISVLGNSRGLDGLSLTDRNQQIVDRILTGREVSDVEGFLSPKPVDEHFLTNAQALFGGGLTDAVDLVVGYLMEMEEDPAGSIVIHGDYDVDGVSATAILWETIYYECGYKNVMPFIPHRVNHGYGVSIESVDEIVKQLTEKGLKPGLLVTVDCGITTKDSIAYAKSLGFTVIITDHHTKPYDDAKSPIADATLHTYELCGAGISWVLSRSIVEGQAASGLLSGVDLVALATLADIQPLTGFNRSLVKAGLEALSRTSRLGLLALYRIAGIADKTITPYEVGWVIAPRLNATGRLEHALDALRLLVVRNENQADALAQKLDQLNKERQSLTFSAVEQAITMVEASWNKTSPIIVAHAEWHEGVIGLIAGKLTEKYQVPSIAIAINETNAKGSARSIEGINIVTILRTCEHLFEGVGGHAAAAGFTLGARRVDELVSVISNHVLTNSAEVVDDATAVDLELDLNWVNYSLYEELAKLEPHGLGNPRPVFYSKGVEVVDKKVVGKTGDHLSLQFKNGLRGIGFGMGAKITELGDNVELVYTVDKDDFKGGTNVQVKVKQIE